MFNVSAGTTEFEVVEDGDSEDQGAVSDNQADASNEEAGTFEGNQASTSEDSDSKNSASITIDPLPVEDMTEEMISASSDKLLSWM